MYATRATSKHILTKQVAQLSKAAAGLQSTSTTGLRLSCLAVHQVQPHRQFSVSARTQLKEFLPPPEDHEHILATPPAWPHPGYTSQQVRENIKVAHRSAKTWSDKFALFMLCCVRKGMDISTRYHHDPPTKSASPSSDGATSNAVTPQTRYRMSERKWLIRFIFLESVAGVPGMVAASLRHLQSLRRMKRDNGWIETLLEEAYNERMHLLTFLKMAEPGLFMRCMIMGAQGVFYNMMFFSYLISPRTCHRFVGYLEEEAVLTYSLVIEDLEAGLLPKWQTMPAPDIAVQYWQMPEGQRTMRDLLLYIRADEAKHREVNHTLGNLRQKEDPNPFVSSYKGKVPVEERPGKGLEHIRSTGWEREEVI